MKFLEGLGLALAI